MPFESIKPGDDTKDLVGVEEAPDGFHDDFEQAQASDVTSRRKVVKQESLLSESTAASDATRTRGIARQELPASTEREAMMRAETQERIEASSSASEARTEVLQKQRQRVQHEIESPHSESVTAKLPKKIFDRRTRAQASQRVSEIPTPEEVNIADVKNQYLGIQKEYTDPKEREQKENELAIETAMKFGVPEKLAKRLVSEHRRYLPTGFIGKGGMGLVLEVQNLHNPDLPRDVVKFLLTSPERSSESFDRFKREAVTAANLNLKNKHIVNVRDADFSLPSEGYFMVLEKAEGKDLKQELQEGQTLSVEESVDLAEQLAAALNEIHQHGLVHRDIKPANIFVHQETLTDPVTGEESVRRSYKLGDLGLVKFHDEKEPRDWQKFFQKQIDLTQSGSVVGTPQYMAPEQLRGESSAASDIFALGHTLYEALTGRSIFRKEAKTMSDVIMAVNQYHVMPLTRRAKILGLDLPESLVSLVDDMIAAKSEDRPSAADVMTRLAEVRAEMSSPAAPKLKQSMLKKIFPFLN